MILYITLAYLTQFGIFLSRVSYDNEISACSIIGLLLAPITLPIILGRTLNQ